MLVTRGTHKRLEKIKRFPGPVHIYLWTNRALLSEKAMATKSSTLAWKIPWMEEPGRLQSLGSLRVGHD